MRVIVYLLVAGASVFAAASAFDRFMKESTQWKVRFGLAEEYALAATENRQRAKLLSKDRQMLSSDEEITGLKDDLIDVRTRRLQLARYNLQDAEFVKYTRAASVIFKAGDIARQGKALSYLGRDAEIDFELRYPGYSQHKEDLNVGSGSRQFWQKWLDQQRATTKATLESFDLSYIDMEKETSVLNGLKRAAETAKGRRAINQAANQISLYQIETAKKLQAAIIQQTRLQADYYASEAAITGKEHADWKSINAPRN